MAIEEQGIPQEVNPEQTEQAQEQSPIPDPFAEMFQGEELFGIREEEPESQREELPDTAVNSKQEELDKKTFSYWQSMADKSRNENERLKAQLAQAQVPQVPDQQLPSRNPQGQFERKENVVEPKEEQKFPEPPARPDKPRTYSRGDALTDDRSESAQYLDDMEQWRSDMVEYNAYRQRYNEIQTEKKWESQQDALKKQQQQRVAREQQTQQLNQIATTLRDGYQATDDQISDFMREMSRKESVSTDNLWKLYALNHGIPIQSSQQTTPQIGQSQQKNNNEPSPLFQQQSIAQQVPSPMGILPANSSESAKSEVDLMFDEMKRIDSRDNPFAYGNENSVRG